MKRVLLLLAPGFEDAEAAVALTACAWSAYRPALPEITVDVAAFDGHAQGKFGSVYEADVLVGDVDADAYDALVIPGGFRNAGFERIYCEDVYKIIRAMHAKGAPIATMCVGVLSVARADVLKGGSATTYEFSRHSNYAILEECGVAGVHEPVHVCDGVCSCAGPAYSEDVMHWLLGKLLGEEAAEELATFRRGISG